MCYLWCLGNSGTFKRFIVMEQYISKDALVAEIERRLHFDNNWIEGDKRRQIHQNGISSAYYKKIGSKHTCESLLDFINTLEVKEMDMKKELSYEDYIRFFDEHPNFPDDWGFDEAWVFAKHFFELGMQVSNKAQKGE